MAYTDYIRQTPEGYIRVVNSADYDSIVSYTPLPDIVVYTGAVVNLPNTVQATFKSGKVETMIIKWERVNVDTSTAGTQKIYGDIGNGAAAVLQNVIVKELTDLDILRQIRDANPTSQLPALWLDSEDPYTQWEGVDWFQNKVVALNVISRNISNLINIKYLKNMQTILCANNPISSLDLSLNTKLININCSNNNLLNINIPNTNTLIVLILNSNKLKLIPTLLLKGNITNYNFTNNNFSTIELDRFRSLGFTDESKLLPQNP